MPGGQAGLGFGQNQQVLEFQVVFDFELFLRQQARLLFLFDQGPDALAGVVRGMKVGEFGGRDVSNEKIHKFIGGVY